MFSLLGQFSGVFTPDSGTANVHYKLPKEQNKNKTTLTIKKHG